MLLPPLSLLATSAVQSIWVSCISARLDCVFFLMSYYCLGVTRSGQSSKVEKREGSGGSRAQGSGVRLQGSEAAALNRDLEQPLGSGGPLAFSRPDSDGLPWSPLWTGMACTSSKDSCACLPAQHLRLVYSVQMQITCNA